VSLTSVIGSELQIQPYSYNYETKFFENGAAALQRKNTDPLAALRKTIDSIQEKLKRKNEVVFELLEAHLQLKKTWGNLK
jgi:hypothetical protein